MILTCINLHFVTSTGTQTTCLHLALSCAAITIFLKPYMKSVLHTSLSRSVLQLFFRRHHPHQPCSVRCSTCLAMLSSILRMYPKHFLFSSQLQSLHVLSLHLLHSSLIAIFWPVYVNSSV